jgi:hypothetical protein
LLEVPAGKGSLLILTTSWLPADSQFALSSKFVPFLYSILEQSGGIKTRLAQYLVGDEVALPTAEGAKPLSIITPDGKRSELPAETAQYAVTAPGIYTLVSLQATQRFAVNLDAAESKTAPLDMEELERLGLPLKHRTTVDPKKIEEKRRMLQATELEGRQKLWRWLLLTALVVLLLESWVAGRLVRPAPASPSPST